MMEFHEITTGNGLIAACHMSGTRQTPPLPCVEGAAHGKELGTRQSLALPCAGTTDTRQTKDTRQMLHVCRVLHQKHTAKCWHTAKHSPKILILPLQLLWVA